MTAATNFAAARERVLERRRQQELEARTRAADSCVPAPSSSSLLSSRMLDVLCGRARRCTSAGVQPSFRVGQADAELLDDELVELLRAQVGDALKFFGPHLSDDWANEVTLGLRAALFKLSIWDHNASYGAALQNLQYTDSRSKGPVYSPPTRWQKALYGLFTVGGRYAWDRWEAWLVDQEGGYQEPSPQVRTLSRITNVISTAHSIATLVSFLVFLTNGRYRTLTDRILRMRLVPPSRQVSREVSFEYLNRQLVWHAFTEFLLFLLPLVGIGRWRRWLSRAWQRTVAAVRDTSGDDGADREKQGEYAFLPERTCPICYQERNPVATSEADVLAASGSGGVIGSAQTDVANPYETVPCGCLYCFVCIAQKLELDDGDGWTCLRCGESVTQCRPWRGDVLEEPTAGATAGGKSVVFAADDEIVPQPATASGPGSDSDSVGAAGEGLDGTSLWSSVDRDETPDAGDAMGAVDDGPRW